MQIKIDMPVYALVRCQPKDGDWNVKDVELYADADRTRLLADDCWKDFDAEQRATVYRQLNAWDARTHELSRDLIELMRPVQL